MTLPCTFAIEPPFSDAPLLAACVACAVHDALIALTPPQIDLKIKWPNDIVARSKQGDRKLAGILIERRDGLTLVGVGVNCLQKSSDWDQKLRDASVSLDELDSHATRLDVVCRFVQHLSHWFAACDRHAIRDYYQMHDAMIGTLRTFRVGRVCHRGIVESLDPLECITLKTPGGSRTLPIAQTTHIRADGPCEH